MAWAGPAAPRAASAAASASGRKNGARVMPPRARGGRARARRLDVAWPDLPHGMSAGNSWEAGTVTKRGWHRRDKCNYRKRSVNKRTSWAPRIPASRARLLACANRAGRVPIRAGRQGLACAARMRNVKNNRLSARPREAVMPPCPPAWGPTPHAGVRHAPCRLFLAAARHARPAVGHGAGRRRHHGPGPGRAPCAGAVPAAGQHGPGLVARDLRHGHGAAEPDLGRRPALHRHDRRPPWFGQGHRRRAGFLCGRTDRHDARGHAGDVRADGGDLRRHRPVRHRLRRHLRRVEPAGRAPSGAAGRWPWPARSADWGSSRWCRRRRG